MKQPRSSQPLSTPPERHGLTLLGNSVFSTRSRLDRFSWWYVASVMRTTAHETRQDWMQPCHEFRLAHNMSAVLLCLMLEKNASATAYMVALLPCRAWLQVVSTPTKKLIHACRFTAGVRRDRLPRGHASLQRPTLYGFENNGRKSDEVYDAWSTQYCHAVECSASLVGENWQP